MKLQKRQKLRNAEYFDLQEILDSLYAKSKQNQRFTKLMEFITADENILLAYRNICKNKGSKTAGTDGKDIRFLSKFTNENLIHYIKRRVEHYQPQPVHRVEIPKGDTGKTRPLGIPTIADRLIQQCFLQILEPICELWLKERLGLDISPEKSKIVNLKKRYSDFLGFKLKAVKKGKKYAVESHMSDKAVKKVKNQAREMVKRIQFPANVNEEYKAIGAYNAYVSGVHNYYRFATHISKDMRKISLSTTRTMKNRLRERLQRTGDTVPSFIAGRYGKSKQLRFVSGQALIPIGYIQTKAPLYKRREVNQYTPEGRESIHKHLQKVDMGILHSLMRNPVPYTSVEFKQNRLALYCAQQGRCAVTKEPMELNEIHCHHKTPRALGGTDAYSNLVLVSKAVHILIHAVDGKLINHYLQSLNLKSSQFKKLNALRKTAGMPLI